MATPAPFLRWAGGKRKSLRLIHAALHKDFVLSEHRFYEPFVGGGAVMFSLSQFELRSFGRRQPIVINDVNEDLVATYRALRDEPEAVIRGLKKLESRTSENDYYRIRGKTPATSIDRAIRLIYLNRTGFNGLYRVNSSGEFNVPWGKLTNPMVCNEPLLRAVSQWMSRVEIRQGPFSSSVADAQSGDVVYFDPPYIPLSPTSSFSKYARDDFLELDQYALAGVIRGLTSRGVHVVLSNSFTDQTLAIFGDVLNLYVVGVSRSISAQASSRGKVLEVLGTNYELRDCSDPELVDQLRKV